MQNFKIIWILLLELSNVFCGVMCNLENSEFLGMERHLTVQYMNKLTALHSCVMIWIV